MFRSTSACEQRSCAAVRPIQSGYRRGASCRSRRSRSRNRADKEVALPALPENTKWESLATQDSFSEAPNYQKRTCPAFLTTTARPQY